jgi:hypothetical protein
MGSVTRIRVKIKLLRLDDGPCAVLSIPQLGMNPEEGG